MAVQNSLNLNSNGIVTFNSTTGVFSGSTVTQYQVLVGAVNNSIASIATGSAGQAFISGGAAADPSFGTLGIAGGGTGATTFVAYSVVCGGTTTTGALQSVATLGSAGQVLTSQGAGALPQWTSPAGIIVWNEITSASASMSVNNGYLANNVAVVTLTLPATAAQFSILEIKGYGAGGWTIAQAASQQIIFGNLSTTAGVTGSLSSTNANDGVKLLAVVGGASTIWTVLDSVGNISIV
jgi:hypothetical protein